MEMYDWRLLDEDEFVRRVSAKLEERAETRSVSDRDIGRFVMRVYSLEWYLQCSGQGNQWDRAYQEVMQYLYRLARQRYGGRRWIEDMVQEAGLLVARDIQQCHTPAAFMRFIQLKLLNAATDLLRGEKRSQAFVDEWPGEPNESGFENLAPASLDRPETTVICQELYRAFLSRLEVLIQESGRARTQLEAALLKQFGYSAREICDQLSVTLSAVYSLVSRGLKRLRQDEELKIISREIQQSCT